MSKMCNHQLGDNEEQNDVYTLIWAKIPIVTYYGQKMYHEQKKQRSPHKIQWKKRIGQSKRMPQMADKFLV